MICLTGVGLLKGLTVKLSAWTGHFEMDIYVAQILIYIMVISITEDLLVWGNILIQYYVYNLYLSILGNA